MALKIAQFVNLVLAGMLTGNEFGSWVTVHPALDTLPYGAKSPSKTLERDAVRRSSRMMQKFGPTRCKRPLLLLG